jgi:acyl-CoA thioesterase I
MLAAVSAMVVLLGGSTWIHHTDKQIPAPEAKTIHVMIVGGSIAKGEHAPNDYGYLQRTFHSLTVQTGTHYAYTNKSIVGANSTQLATMYKGSYQSWLSQVKPQIVVLSWGLLNDALPKTPMPTFRHYLKQEINDALQRHAVVMVVTPPVTEATYTKFPTQEQRYATSEIQLVNKLHNPNVYAFNLFDQMKRYLEAHNQTIVHYTADPNHPNAAGHSLAARLLYQDIERRFGNRPIAD